MHQAKETPERPSGRLRRARALYRNISTRRTAWLLVKHIVNSCMEYRILGLAAEAAFFTLLSVPPLLLSLIGLLGYVDAWTGADSIQGLENNILEASRTVLSDQGVNQIAKPILADVMKGGRPDVISLGFVFALWSGSRAVNVFIDTITVMYGLDGARGIVKTRLLSFLLFIVALLIGSIALPLMVAGPDAVLEVLPWSTTVVQIFYWPVVIVLSIVFLTTLYHVSVPVRSPWVEDTPGALIALAMWVIGSFLLRIYLVNSVEGPTIYGSLAAPVAVLLWIGVSAFAVLVGAAVNASLDRVWPSVATAKARAAQERARSAQAAQYVAWAAARQAQLDAEDDEPDEEGGLGDPGMPSEFPERWSSFLPPADLTTRLRTKARQVGKGLLHVGGGARDDVAEDAPDRDRATGAQDPADPGGSSGSSNGTGMPEPGAGPGRWGAAADPDRWDPSGGPGQRGPSEPPGSRGPAAQPHPPREAREPGPSGSSPWPGGPGSDTVPRPDPSEPSEQHGQHR